MWRDERGRYFFRYKDQEFAIGRLSGLAVGMMTLAVLSVLDAVFAIGMFDLPFWAFALVVLLPVGVLAGFGGAKLERASGVHDVRAARRGRKIAFVLGALFACMMSLLLVLVALS